MKTILKSTVLALALSFPTLPALAAGWYVDDLGEVAGDRENCMAKARNTVSAYKFEHGGGGTSVGAWTVYAYDLQPGDHDVVIICPVVNGGVVNAFMTLHSDATSEDRDFAGDELNRIWGTQPAK